MKIKLTLLLSLFFGLIYSQEINTTDFLKEIKTYDVSDLWTLNTPEPLGYIGENYQRFFIHFISAIKNPNNRLEYFVYGKTRVKNNICSFQGTIKITKCITYEETDVPDIKQGSVIGEYEFFENPDEKGTGTLKGKFLSDFMIDKNGKFKYDDLMLSADGFENNQFEGVWISYQIKSSKKCNWGDYRIPDSGDLDRGVAEFGPNFKYADYGWENYQQAWFYDSSKPEVQKAREKEKEKWWLKN